MTAEQAARALLELLARDLELDRIVLRLSRRYETVGAIERS